jgi:predicted membrane channel-forming protein YqfA (hemolysin III family)|tara:strand:+ start:164 stop:370 length:207 start_codon:yes stop_codon:yes gene_type:complete
MFSGIIDFVMGIWNLFMIVPIVISICSVIVSLTPTPKDDKLWAKVYVWLEVFALAIGKAKDKNPLLNK